MNKIILITGVMLFCLIAITFGNIYTDRIANLLTIDFDTDSTNVSYVEGRMFYDNVEKTIAVYSDIPDTTLQVGQESFIRVINNNSFTIENGKAVYSTGNKTVNLALANSIETSNVIGIATHDILPGEPGFVTTFGIVRGLNTSAWEERDILFLCPTIPGDIVNYQPELPFTTVNVGVVWKKDEYDGEIFIDHPQPILNRSTNFNIDVFDTLRLGTDMSEIKIGNGVPGSVSAMVFKNLESVNPGEPVFIFANNITPLRTFQSGQPDANSYMRNSQIISGDLGVNNVSKLQNCSWWFGADAWNVQRFVSCNTTTDGSSLINQGDFQNNGRGFFLEGIRSIGNTLMIGTGGDNVIMSDTSLYVVKEEFSENHSFEAGLQYPMTETFSDGNIDPFYRWNPVPGDTREWFAVSNVGCYNSPCATARGVSGVASKEMVANISTLGLSNCNVTFWYSHHNMDNSATDNFKVYLNNNEGSGWVNVFTYNTYSSLPSDTAVFNYSSFPASMDNRSLVSIMMNHTSNSQNEYSFVDNVKVTCTASESYSANTTFHNTLILGGDGDGEDYILFNESEDDGHWYISGHVNIGDILHINPSSIPPHICDDDYSGAIFNDNDINLPCYCNSTNWVQMNDYSTVCI